VPAIRPTSPAGEAGILDLGKLHAVDGQGQSIAHAIGANMVGSRAQVDGFGGLAGHLCQKLGSLAIDQADSVVRHRC